VEKSCRQCGHVFQETFIRNINDTMELAREELNKMTDVACKKFGNENTLCIHSWLVSCTFFDMMMIAFCL